jgi:hypothetical protein
MPRDRRSKTKEKDADVDAFIDAGGSAPDESADEGPGDEVKTFTTRFPKKLVDQIDAAIDEQMVSESRNQWLMKAAVERLKREQG